MSEQQGEMIFAVDDSGAGVADELAGRIFERGVSGKAGSSRGVGLFLVARTLNELGGRIEVARSELGGARFTVHIPKQARR